MEKFRISVIREDNARQRIGFATQTLNIEKPTSNA
jgi:hypothetical protein